MQSFIVVIFFLLCAFGESIPQSDIFAQSAAYYDGQNRSGDRSVDVTIPVAENRPSPLNLAHLLRLKHQESLRLNEKEYPVTGTVALKRSLRSLADFLGLERDGEISDEEELPVKDSDQEISVNEDSGHKNDLEPRISEVIVDREGEISDDEDLPIKDSDQEISVNEDPDRKPDLQPRISEDIDDREGEISDEEDPPVKEPDHDISVDESLADGSNEGRSNNDGEDEEY